MTRLKSSSASIIALRIVLATNTLNLVDSQSEQEKVFFANRFTNLDVGAVERADRHGAIHHEFHVARAGGFLACRRNLRRQIGGGTDDLHRRYVVIRIEQQAQIGRSSSDPR